MRVSYDDGTTWQDAAVARAGSGWAVTVEHPARGSAAFLTTVTDSDGNVLTQTVLRAYRITS